MMNYRQALGSVIRDSRIEQNLTLRKVSDRGNIALGYLSEVERGQKEVSSELLKCIADGLKTPVHELVIAAGYRLGIAQGYLSTEAIAVDSLV